MNWKDKEIQPTILEFSKGLKRLCDKHGIQIIKKIYNEYHDIKLFIDGNEVNGILFDDLISQIKLSTPTSTSQDTSSASEVECNES